MRVTTVFGSASDAPVYDALAEACRKSGHQVSVRVCSAHRTPERLPKVIAEDPHVFIAGAGLAAHLPGAMAAHTLTPVIGVPVASNCEGFDSWVAIVQMPPGIPVLAVCPDVAAASVTITNFLRPFDHVVLEGDTGKVFDKAKMIMENLRIPTSGNTPLTICCTKTGEEKADIKVPISPGIHVQELIEWFNRAKSGGLYVGLNRGENGMLAAAQTIARFTSNNSLKLRLVEYRKKEAQKIIEADIHG